MTLNYKEISIFYTDDGLGEPLIFLHGFLQNHTIWNPYITELTKNNRVVTIDLLGHGETGCLGNIHSMALMADAILAVLEYLKISKYYIIGHSMGGYVALELAKHNPKAIIGICLVNSTTMADSVKRIADRNRAINLVEQNHTTFINMAITNLFGPKNYKLFLNEIKHLKAVALKMKITGITAALEGMKIRLDNTSVFEKHNFKKLIIIGKTDSVIDGDTLYSKFKNTDTKFLKLNGGHLSFIEERKILLQNIMHFIE